MCRRSSRGRRWSPLAPGRASRGRLSRPSLLHAALVPPAARRRGKFTLSGPIRLLDPAPPEEPRQKPDRGSAGGARRHPSGGGEGGPPDAVRIRRNDSVDGEDGVPVGEPRQSPGQEAGGLGEARARGLRRDLELEEGPRPGSSSPPAARGDGLSRCRSRQSRAPRRSRPRQGRRRPRAGPGRRPAGPSRRAAPPEPVGGVPAVTAPDAHDRTPDRLGRGLDDEGAAVGENGAARPVGSPGMGRPSTTRSARPRGPRGRARRG